VSDKVSPYSTGPRKPLHVKDAFRVAHVCSDWRWVATSTPGLWAGPVDLDLCSRRYRLSQDTGAAALKAWLVRSAPLAVPVSFAGFRYWEAMTRMYIPR
jgi:hypothetical protein